MKPLISVIVPVYRVEEFLPRCVDSLRAQTYENLEIILVDDGSPDHCPEICEKYAARDVRIRVIHQENRGLSGARNAGIDAAAGEYLAFVDSDDYVTEDFIESLYTLAEETGCPIAQVQVFLCTGRKTSGKRKSGLENLSGREPDDPSSTVRKKKRLVLLWHGTNYTERIYLTVSDIRKAGFTKMRQRHTGYSMQGKNWLFWIARCMDTTQEMQGALRRCFRGKDWTG